MSDQKNEAGGKIETAVTGGQAMSAEVLDQNLARLLRHAKEPPRLAPEVRARILAAIKEKQKKTAGPVCPAPEDAATQNKALFRASEKTSPSLRGSVGSLAPSRREFTRRAHEAAASSTLENQRELAGEASAPAKRTVGGAGQDPPEASATASKTRVLPFRRASQVVGGLVALAAAAALLLLLWPKEVVPPVVYENPLAAVEAVALKDGSTLLLRQGARVVALGERHLSLEEGDILLDVAKGETPFQIKTPHGKVTVLGTRFVLQATQKETRAAVIRGVVRLESAGETALLRAGEEGACTQKSPPTRRPADRLSYLTSWAKEARQEKLISDATPARSGLLLARNPRWQEQEQALPLRRFVVDVHIEDQVARVALDQTFFNPSPMTLEGVYSFPLPADAAISRLAMYVEGKLMEAGIVERQHGRQVYESIVYQRRDPALLEWMQGNAFRLRIFPLPGRTEKRILLSYTQTLPRLYDGYRLEVPIPALSQPVGEVFYQVRLVDGAGLSVSSSSHAVETRIDGSDQLVTVRQKNERLGGGLILHLKEEKPASTRASFYKDQEGSYLLFGVTPELGGEAGYEPRRWVLLNDTSASRGPLERKAQTFLASRLLEEWDEDDELAVIAFDATVRVMSPSFMRVGDIDPAEVARFLEKESRDGVGYTDLEAGLRAAVELLGDDKDKAPYILYLGDGIANSKKPDIDRLRSVVEGKASVVAVAVGSQMDAPTLRGLSEATGGLFAAVNPGEDLSWRAFDLIATLNTPRVLGLRAELLDEEGAPLKEAKVYPSSRQLADGEELVVVAKLGEVRPATISLTGTRGKEPWSLKLSIPEGAKDAKYLPRLFAQRHIDALLVDGAEEHKDEITALGMARFLVTPFTSLLVLENDEMYKDFKVNRGSEDDWARYSAPKTIPVRYEPGGSALTLSLPKGAALTRAPVPIFGARGGAYRGMESSFQVLMKSDSPKREANEFAQDESSLKRQDDPGFWGIGAGGGGEGQIFAQAARTESTITSRITVSAESGPVGANVWSAQTIALPSGGASAGFFDLENRRSAFDSITPTLVLGAFDKTGARSRDADGKGWVGGLFAEENKKSGKSRGYQSPAPVPSAFHYATDPRLDDLTEFVPGLFGSGFDQVRDHLLYTVAKEKGSVTPDALDLLKEAKSRAQAGRWVYDGTSIEVSEEGRFRVSRTLDTGLKEEVFYDGASLTHQYPELGLAVQREVGFAEPMLFMELLPFLVPQPEHLGLIYKVTLLAPRTLKLVPVSDALPTLEMGFDEEYRVKAIRISPENGDAREIQFAYTADALTITRGETRAALQSEPTTGALSVDPSLTLVKMPLRAPAHWEEELLGATPGSEEWRSLQQQRMAAYAALGQASQNGVVLQEILKETGSLLRGEAVLASGAVRYQGDKVWGQISKLLGKGDPVARYFAACGALYTKNKSSLFDALAKDQAGSLLGMLSSYRILLAKVYSYTKPGQAAALSRAKEFLAAYSYEPFRYIVVYQYSAYHNWRNPEGTVALWDEIAKSSLWRYAAKYEAARVLYNRGRSDEAATRFEAAFEEAVLAGLLPTIDYSLYYALRYSSRGEAGWNYFWSRWRARVIQAKDPMELIPFLEAIAVTGSWKDVDRVVASLREKTLESPALAVQLIDVLRQLGKYDAAWTILSPWLEEKEPSGALLHLASLLAEARGRSREAARFLEKTLAALDGQTIPLPEVRRAYARLFGLYAHLTQAPQGEREADLDRALATAASWRRIDPDNPEIDILCANLFYALGDPKNAWRHLSSIIERHPAEGASYEKVAGILEGEGRLKEADLLWVRAFEVEPTNPTWLYRRAQNLLTLGDNAEASPLLKKVVDGSWQERFAPAKGQAKELQKRFMN